MGKVTVVAPAFEQSVDLIAEKCCACQEPLRNTAYAGQQVGSVSTGPTGLPEIAMYHWECSPVFLRAAVRANECKTMEAMLEEDPKTCGYMIYPGSSNPDHFEQPEYCDSDAAPGSEFCTEHEWAVGYY